MSDDTDDGQASIDMNRYEDGDDEIRETPKTRDIIVSATDPDDVKVYEDAPIDDGTDPGDAVEVTFSHGEASRSPADGDHVSADNHVACSRCRIQLTRSDMERYWVEYSGSRPFTYCRACFYDLMRAGVGEVVEWPPEEHRLDKPPEGANHEVPIEELMLRDLEGGYVRHDLVLALVRAHPDPVVEAYDIAEYLPISTTTVHERLSDLVEDGHLEMKDMRANRKVFWDDDYTETHRYRGPLYEKVEQAWEEADVEEADE